MRLERRLVLALPLALFSCTAPERPAPAHAPAQAAPALQPRAESARIAADVAWLADDAREGRRAGTEQGLVSADWIATRLRELGLEPAGENGTFLQEFKVPLEPRSGGGSYLEVVDRRTEDGTNVAPLYCSDRGLVEAPLVWCGYGIEAPDAGWNDYASIDVTGAIAVIVRGSPTRAPKVAPAKPAETAAPSPHGDTGMTARDPFANASLVFTKVMTAKRRGAKAVVLVQHDSQQSEPLLAFGRGGEARAGLPCLTLRWSTARELLGEALGTLSESEPATPHANTPSGRVFADVLREHGPARNVIGVVPGVDRSRAVLVGAHYDHLGFGGTGSLAQNERAIHNGADDNASGTAAVLEVARLLASGPKPASDVVIALWSGEELGLLGSEHWADAQAAPLGRVHAGINLDMVGRLGTGKLQVLAAGSAEPFGDWVESAARTAGLGVEVSRSANVMGGSSDHATFLKRRVPALHLFTGIHGDYHKPSDDTDKVDVAGAAKVADLALELARLAAGATTLAFVEPKTDASDQPRIQSGFRAWFGSIPNYQERENGVLIDGTSSGSPAERAGFQKGDVLLELGDVKLGSVNDFTYALQYYKAGDVVKVVFERDGKREEMLVTLGSRGVR